MPFGTPIETEMSTIDRIDEAGKKRIPRARNFGRLAVGGRQHGSFVGGFSLNGGHDGRMGASEYGVEFSQKRPAWKPEVLSKRGQKLRVEVIELVTAMIYSRDPAKLAHNEMDGGGSCSDGDGSNRSICAQDVCQIRGMIECESQLNGVPEVSLSLSCGGNLWMQRGCGAVARLCTVARTSSM